MKEKYELAYDDYISGMKYKDIAAKYDVSVSAVKSWKSRYWKDKKLQPKKSKVATKKVAREIAENIVDDNGELDEDKQLLLKISQSCKGIPKSQTESYIRQCSCHG